MLLLHQADGAASEAASGHSRSIDSRRPARNVDECIQLGATHFEIVAETAMRLIHQLSKCRQIPLFESHRSRKHAGILRDHVPASLVYDLRELAALAL